MPPRRRKRSAQLEKDYEEVAEDEDSEDLDNNARRSQRDELQNLHSLDDDVLFGVLKKVACNVFRQLLSTGIGASSADNVGNTRIRSTTRVSGTSGARVRKKIVNTRQNVSYFAETVQKLKLNPEKCKVIEDYGFGSLLSFDKCIIPLPFSCWIADHIQVKSSDIVVMNKSIPISVQTVRDVLDIPIGGRPIVESDSDKGKKEFLGALKLTRFPNFKTFGDKLLKDDISDDEVVRCFLIVALCTFLCPNSNTYPSPKYLLPLVDVKSAKEWDWSELVYSWLMKKVRRYQKLRAESPHASLTLGGCLYLIDVVYLDSLMFGPHGQLPSTLPRISVWKQNMIKEFSELDCVEGYIFGKRPILPFKSTCYARKTGERTPSPVCNTDVSDFHKELLHRVPGTFSPETLDDLTALYTKHAAPPPPSEMPYGSAKSIIVDVIQYFCQRSQRDKSAGNIPSMNNGEASGSRSFSNIDEDDHRIPTRNNIAPETGQFSDDDNGNVMPHVQSPLEVAPEVSSSTPGEGMVGTKEGSSVEKDRSCYAMQPRLRRRPQAKEVDVVMSGDTELVPSCGGGSVHVSSTAETEKVSSTSLDVLDLVQSSQGCDEDITSTYTTTTPTTIEPSIPQPEARPGIRKVYTRRDRAVLLIKNLGVEDKVI